jgi:hypothetical protein
MKKFTGCAMGLFLCLLAHSQMSLSFCTFVNAQDRECVFDNVKFITSPDSTHARLYIMVKSSEVFGVEKLLYKIYAIDRFGNEVFLNTIQQDVHADWQSSWQPAIFNSPGKYMVKVYKDDEHMLAGKGFEFFNY